MNWSWSAEEDEAMDYLPHAAQVLYMRVLRRRMDFGSGVVGISCKLSYTLIAEWLEVRPPVKSTKPIVRLTRGEIRHALEQLEKAGLIVRVVANGEVLPLVFSLPLARTGLIREKYEQPDEQPEKRIRATRNSGLKSGCYGYEKKSEKSIIYDLFSVVDKCTKNNEFLGMSNQKNQYEQPDEQHTSGMSCLGLTSNIPMRARGNGCAISENWLPSVSVVQRIVFELRLDPRFLKLKAIEFRLLWREQNIIALNWDEYFFGACRNRVAERDGEFLSAILPLASGGDHAR